MNTYSPTYSDDDDEMGDIVEAYAEQEATDRPTDTDNARRRHLAEMTRQAFADGLYETSAVDYAEALRRARAEPTTDIAEDAWEVIVRVRDDYPRVINDAPTEEIVEALADAGLLATVRTRPTREQVTAAIGDAANSMQVGFGVVSITAAVDAVLALYTYQPTRDDLARAIASGYEPDHPTPNRHDYRAADAVLALFNEKGD